MTELKPMSDHWWWRPGWRVGRSGYAWHVTFDDQPEARQLVALYGPMLAGLPMLDPVPARWLHLTTQAVGFVDEVAPDDVDRIVAAARLRCASLEPFRVSLGPARVEPESVYLPVRPAEPLVELRSVLRAAVADVWGQDDVPGSADGFRPHVSLGYSNSSGPAAPIVEALDSHATRTADIVVSAVSLIEINRDHKAYEWTDVATVRLGHESAPDGR